MSAVRWESPRQGTETHTISPTRQPASKAKQNPKRARAVRALGTVHLTLCVHVRLKNRIKIIGNKKITRNGLF